MNDATSARLRNLTKTVTSRPTDLPVRELVELVESQTRDLTIDLSEDPVVVLARPRRHRVFSTLSNREQEVARLIAAGYSNQQIATALFISIGTVKDHVHAVLSKTGLDSRSRVIAGWLGSPDFD